MFRAESLTPLAAVALILAACAPTYSTPAPPQPGSPGVQHSVGDLEPERRAEREPTPARVPCYTYVGQTVTPTPFEAFASGPPKGEFETIAQYAARQAAAFGPSAGPIIIEKEPEDREKHFKYDAETQSLRVISYALHNTNMSFHSAFESARQLGLGTDFLDNNLAVVISRDERVTRTYEASNAFGATVLVAEVERDTRAIFERKRSLDENLFALTYRDTTVIGELPLSPSEAQRLKPVLKAGFVVAPKPPYVVTGTHKPYNGPTFQNPRDVTENFFILIADIQCGLLMDGENRVLQAYLTL